MITDTGAAPFPYDCYLSFLVDVPRDSPLEPLVKGDLCFEPELFLCPGNYKAPPGLAIRLAGVPADLPLEPGKFPDNFHKASDGDLAAGTKVYRVRFVILLCGKDNSPCCILDIQEFP